MKISTGLDISNDAVKIVVLQKFFNRFRLVKFGEEKFASPKPSSEEIIAAIRRLFERLRIKNKDVVIHLGGAGVRYLVLEAPLLSAAELFGWIRHHCTERLPKTAHVAQLIFAYHILQQTGDSLKLMVCYCQPHVLQERLQWVEAAGLAPVMVGAGELDLLHAFTSGAEEVLNKNFLFIDRRQHTTALLLAHNGNPVLYHEAENGNIQRILSSWQAGGQNLIDKIILVGDEAAVEAVRAVLPTDVITTIGQPLPGLLKNGQALPPPYSFAAGLALKKFYPLLNTIDLLPDEHKTKIKKQREKQRALRVMLIGGLAALLSVAALNFLKAMMTNQLEASQAQVLAFQSQIAALEQLKTEQVQLRRSLSDMQRLVTQRSQCAQLLEEISRVMPEGAWLQELSSASGDTTIAKQSPGAFKRLQLRGWALDDGKIAALLEQLERSSFFSEVRLVATIRLPAAEVWEKTKLKKIPLDEFTMELQ